MLNGTKVINSGIVHLWNYADNFVNKGIELRADIENTVTVYIGFNSDITPGTNNNKNGFPLYPGESFLFELRHPADVYAVCSSGNPKLHFLMV